MTRFLDLFAATIAAVLAWLTLDASWTIGARLATTGTTQGLEILLAVALLYAGFAATAELAFRVADVRRGAHGRGSATLRAPSREDLLATLDDLEPEDVEIGALLSVSFWTVGLALIAFVLLPIAVGTIALLGAVGVECGPGAVYVGLVVLPAAIAAGLGVALRIMIRAATGALGRGVAALVDRWRGRDGATASDR